MKILPLGLLLLSPLLTLPTLGAPSKPPIASPKAGEIALQGRVASFDVVENILVLRATSFTTASGRRAILAAPKSKTIIAQATTPVFDAAGKPASLGDVGKDDEIEVIGRDGGKGLAARLIVWHRREIVEIDADTPPEVAPFLPASQGAFGASLRPIDALWTPKNTVHHPFKFPMPTFLTRWKLRTETPLGNDEWGTPLPRSAAVRLVKISGPHGEPLDALSRNTSDFSESGDVEFQLSKDDVDPRWPFISFEWELRDAKSSVADTGVFVSNLKWDDLSIPKKVGGKTDVGRELVSPNGTRIRLVSIGRGVLGLPKSADWLHFDFQAEKSAKAPDAQMQIMMSGLSAEKGNYRQTSGAYGWSGNLYEVSTQAIPPSNAGKLTLDVRLIENVPSLQNRSKYRRLKFQIPVAALWKAQPLQTKAKAPISADNAQLKVEMEGTVMQGGTVWAALWVHDKANPAPRETDWRYLLTAGTVSNRDGQTSKLYFLPAEASRRFVREDGQIAAPELVSENLQANVAEVARDSGPLDFRLDFERARWLSRFATFADIALPAANEVKSLKPDQIANDFFEVRRVVRFDDAQIFTGLPASTRGNLKSGVAVVIEFSPLFPDAELKFRLLQAADPQGHFWDTFSSTSNVFTGDATLAGDRNLRVRTVILPGFKAAKVTLDVMASERQLEGSPKQTLQFHVP